MRGAWAVLAAAVVLGGSGVGLGLGVARLVAGDTGAGAALLVLGPLLVGAPLGAGLAIWGAAAQGWLRRWASPVEGPAEEGPAEEAGAGVSHG